MSLPRNTMKSRLGPGLWEDMEGNVHWSLPELLQMAGIEDTPENQAELRAMLNEMLRTETPETIVIHRDKPD